MTIRIATLARRVTRIEKQHGQTTIYGPFNRFLADLGEPVCVNEDLAFLKFLKRINVGSRPTPPERMV